MAKWLLAGLAIATAALGLFLWRGLSKEPAPQTQKAKKTRSSPTQQTKGQKADQAPHPAEITPALVNEAQTRRKPTEKEVEMEAVGRFLGGAVVQELYAQAARCYQGEEGRSEAITVSYRLRVEGGTATSSGVSLLKSELGNRRLDDCVVKTIDGYSWPVADGFELDEPNERASFSIVGLKKRHRIHAEDD